MVNYCHYIHVGKLILALFIANLTRCCSKVKVNYTIKNTLN